MAQRDFSKIKKTRPNKKCRKYSINVCVCRAARAENTSVLCGNLAPTDYTTGATSTGKFDTSVRRAQGLLDAKKNTGHGEKITITFGASFILYSKADTRDGRNVSKSILFV